MHRSLQLSLRARLRQYPAKRQQVFEKAVTIVQRALSTQSSKTKPVYEHCEAYEKYQPHVLSLKNILKLADPALDVRSDIASFVSEETSCVGEEAFGTTTSRCQSL